MCNFTEFHKKKKIYIHIWKTNIVRLARRVYSQMKRLADFKQKHEKLLSNPLPREEKKLFTDNNVVNVLVDRDQKNRRILVINMGCTYDEIIIILLCILTRSTPQSSILTCARARCRL